MFNLQKNSANITAYTLIALSLVFGFFIRLFSVLRYTTFFYYDQARDAEIYMKMWQGNWPILGPSASVGGYHLPPLYYYLVFPFTIFGSNPVFTAIPNALFSFLSIPLLIYLVYELLENVESSKRLLLAGLAGFWYSLIFGEIFISTFQWNPSPIVFFLLCFTLLYKYQLEARFSLVPQCFSWILYGIVLAILISLHSTTLFVMPVVFIASSILFISKNRRTPIRFLLPILSVLAAFVALFPYWKGEISRGWLNTKQILVTLTTSDKESNSNVLSKISRLVFNYVELGQQAYFTGEGWFYTLISILFLAVVLTVGIAKFKGNKTIFSVLAFTWAIYLYAASNYQGIYYVHYKLLILIAPIVLTILSLAYLDVSKTTEKLLSGFLVAGIVLSILINTNYDYHYLTSKYSQNRLVSTSDITQILSQLPANSTICTFDPKPVGWMSMYQPYKYIDQYITKKNFNIVKTFCQAGHYLVYPKSYMVQRTDNLFPVFNVYRNPDLAQDYSTVLETPVANVYLLK